MRAGVVLVALLGLLAPGPSSADDDVVRAARNAIYRARDSRDTDHAGWARAAELLAPLLAEGDLGARFYASYLYAYGKGGYPRDPDMAARLRLEAANAGFVEAMVDQARRRELGLGQLRDLPGAVGWYEKAARAGSRLAAGRLVQAYTRGELGLAADEVAAGKWRAVRGKLDGD